MTDNAEMLSRMVAAVGGSAMPRAPYVTCPPIEAVVQIDVMTHMMLVGHREMPGGLYGIVTRSSVTNGDLQVITIPRSLLSHPRYAEWAWAKGFPFDMNGNGLDYMRLLNVPDYVEAAVMALAQLSDTLPVVVDDGWLC